ncbi:unnamed protein product, partial [marine sediment metagenome]
KGKKFFSLCGKLYTNESAEQLIHGIHDARHFNSNRDISF